MLAHFELGAGVDLTPGCTIMGETGEATGPELATGPPPWGDARLELAPCGCISAPPRPSTDTPGEYVYPVVLRSPLESLAAAEAAVRMPPRPPLPPPLLGAAGAAAPSPT